MAYQERAFLMKNRIAAIQVGLLLMLALFLGACGAEAKPQIAEAAAKTTPVPVVTVTPLSEIDFPDGSVHKTLERRVDLSALHHEDVAAAIEALKQMPKLRYVNLGTEDAAEEKIDQDSAEDSGNMIPRGLTWEDIRAL